MTDRTCNGWKNHATWLINVWTDGDDEIARISQASGNRYDRTQALKEYVTEYYLERATDKASLMSDLLSSALCDVDWYELADKYIEMRNNEEEDNETVA